jgi:hypothetical protein
MSSNRNLETASGLRFCASLICSYCSGTTSHRFGRLRRPLRIACFRSISAVVLAISIFVTPLMADRCLVSCHARRHPIPSGVSQFRTTPTCHRIPGQQRGWQSASACAPSASCVLPARTTNDFRRVSDKHTKSLFAFVEISGLPILYLFNLPKTRTLSQVSLSPPSRAVSALSVLRI